MRCKDQLQLKLVGTMPMTADRDATAAAAGEL
jgi:hypothetical protein